MLTSVKLIENFVTWQGEGPHSGRRMIILRFKTCNLKCPWCDTAVKMRVSAEAEYTLESIQNQININKAGIMVTGGEPTVSRHFLDSIKLLSDLDYSIANVETNGYNLPQLINQIDSRKPVYYIFSPKIFGPKDVKHNVELTSALAKFTNVFIKFVYEGADFQNVFLNQITEVFDCEKIWLMPEGVTRDNLIKNSEIVFDACEKYNVNFSSRNHIIYGFV